MCQEYEPEEATNPNVSCPELERDNLVVYCSEDWPDTGPCGPGTQEFHLPLFIDFLTVLTFQCCENDEEG